MSSLYGGIMLSAEKSLARLKEGNRRFLSGELTGLATFGPKDREQLVIGQHPFAVILGCSDSRVPIELLFDQGFGDLFVIRIAGNVVARSQLGSVEYAIQELGVKLVVVMGHAHCGAVAAAIAASRDGITPNAEHLNYLVQKIMPSLMLNGEDPETILDNCIQANSRRSAQSLASESIIIKNHIEQEDVRVLPAHFSIKTGEVEFLD